MQNRFGQGVERARSETGVVFWVTAALPAASILWGVLFPRRFGVVASAAFGWTVSDLSWFYVVATTFFPGFCIWLAFSHYGRIRLDKEGDEPEFRWFSWVVMMFCAGTGHQRPRRKH